MKNILTYLLTEWDVFVTALEKLVDYHKATGTLPTIPDPPAAGSTGAADITGSPGATAAAPTAITLPTGVVLVDSINGLFTVDPSLGNPDTAGQTFNSEAFLPLFDKESQAAYTTRQNNADALSAQGPGQLGMHAGVLPMVATDDTRKFIYAPATGKFGNEPWIPKAWTITAGTVDAFLDHVLHHWKLPTKGDSGGTFVPGQ